jgi:hypothetical protein
MKRHYIALNSYRSSSSNGFANTWRYYLCDKATQNRLLKEGLETYDTDFEMKSTMGIRLLTRQEIRRFKAEMNNYGEILDKVF